MQVSQFQPVSHAAIKIQSAGFPGLENASSSDAASTLAYWSSFLFLLFAPRHFPNFAQLCVLNYTFYPKLLGVL